MTCFSVWSVWSEFLEGLGLTQEEAWQDARDRIHQEYVKEVPPYEEPFQTWWQATASGLVLCRLEFWAPPERVIPALRHLADISESKLESWRATLDELISSSQRHLDLWGVFQHGRLCGLGVSAERARQDAQARWASLVDGDVMRLQLSAPEARRQLWELVQAPPAEWERWRETFEWLTPGEWCPSEAPACAKEVKKA